MLTRNIFFSVDEYNCGGNLLREKLMEMKKHTIPFTSEWREWINGFYIAALIVYVLYVIFKIVAMDLDAEE